MSDAAEPQFSIEPCGPFSWQAATDVLARFQPLRHHWQGQADVVRMTFPLDGDYTPVAVALRYRDGALHGTISGGGDLDAVARQVARIFSLDHDGTSYPEVGERDPRIGALQAALPGLRPVCFTSPYETAAWAVLSQRISMNQAAATLQTLLAEHGHPLLAAGEEVRCFPTPERLLALHAVPGLAALKIERLRGVARAALDGLLDADHLRALGDTAAPEALRAIPGIGPFWSSGIYLRGCGIADIFPDEPLAIAALGRLHERGDQPSHDTVRTLSERYRPFRMWVCFLLRVAAGRGLISGLAGRENTIRAAARKRPRVA